MATDTDFQNSMLLDIASSVADVGEQAKDKVKSSEIFGDSFLADGIALSSSASCTETDESKPDLVNLNLTDSENVRSAQEIDLLGMFEVSKSALTTDSAAATVNVSNTDISNSPKNSDFPLLFATSNDQVLSSSDSADTSAVNQDSNDLLNLFSLSTPSNGKSGCNTSDVPQCQWNIADKRKLQETSFDANSFDSLLLLSDQNNQISDSKDTVSQNANIFGNFDSLLSPTSQNNEAETDNDTVVEKTPFDGLNSLLSVTQESAPSKTSGETIDDKTQLFGDLDLLMSTVPQSEQSRASDVVNGNTGQENLLDCFDSLLPATLPHDETETSTSSTEVKEKALDDFPSLLLPAPQNHQPQEFDESTLLQLQSEVIAEENKNPAQKDLLNIDSSLSNNDSETVLNVDLFNEPDTLNPVVSDNFFEKSRIKEESENVLNFGLNEVKPYGSGDDLVSIDDRRDGLVIVENADLVMDALLVESNSSFLTPVLGNEKDNADSGHELTNGETISKDVAATIESILNWFDKNDETTKNDYTDSSSDTIKDSSLKSEPSCNTNSSEEKVFQSTTDNQLVNSTAKIEVLTELKQNVALEDPQLLFQQNSHKKQLEESECINNKLNISSNTGMFVKSEELLVNSSLNVDLNQHSSSSHNTFEFSKPVSVVSPSPKCDDEVLPGFVFESPLENGNEPQGNDHEESIPTTKQSVSHEEVLAITNVSSSALSNVDVAEINSGSQIQVENKNHKSVEANNSNQSYNILLDDQSNNISSTENPLSSVSTSNALFGTTNIVPHNFNSSGNEQSFCENVMEANPSSQLLLSNLNEAQTADDKNIYRSISLMNQSSVEDSVDDSLFKGESAPTSQSNEVVDVFTSNATSLLELSVSDFFSGQNVTTSDDAICSDSNEDKTSFETPIEAASKNASIVSESLIPSHILSEPASSSVDKEVARSSNTFGEEADNKLFDIEYPEDQQNNVASTTSPNFLNDVQAVNFAFEPFEGTAAYKSEGESACNVISLRDFDESKAVFSEKIISSTFESKSPEAQVYNVVTEKETTVVGDNMFVVEDHHVDVTKDDAAVEIVAISSNKDVYKDAIFVKEEFAARKEDAVAGKTDSVVRIEIASLTDKEVNVAKEDVSDSVIKETDVCNEDDFKQEEYSNVAAKDVAFVEQEVANFVIENATVGKKDNIEAEYDDFDVAEDVVIVEKDNNLAAEKVTNVVDVVAEDFAALKETNFVSKSDVVADIDSNVDTDDGIVVQNAVDLVTDDVVLNDASLSVKTDVVTAESVVDVAENAHVLENDSIEVKDIVEENRVVEERETSKSKEESIEIEIQNTETIINDRLALQKDAFAAADSAAAIDEDINAANKNASVGAFSDDNNTSSSFIRNEQQCVSGILLPLDIPENFMPVITPSEFQNNTNGSVIDAKEQEDKTKLTIADIPLTQFGENVENESIENTSDALAANHEERTNAVEELVQEAVAASESNASVTSFGGEHEASNSSSSDSDEGSEFRLSDMNVSDIDSEELTKNDYVTYDNISQSSLEFDDNPFATAPPVAPPRTKKKVTSTNVIPSSVFMGDDWNEEIMSVEGTAALKKISYDQDTLVATIEEVAQDNTSQEHYITYESGWDEVHYQKPEFDIMPVIYEEENEEDQQSSSDSSTFSFEYNLAELSDDEMSGSLSDSVAEMEVTSHHDMGEVKTKLVENKKNDVILKDDTETASLVFVEQVTCFSEEDKKVPVNEIEDSIEVASSDGNDLALVAESHKTAKFRMSPLSLDNGKDSFPKSNTVSDNDDVTKVEEQLNDAIGIVTKPSNFLSDNSNDSPKIGSLPNEQILAFESERAIHEVDETLSLPSTERKHLCSIEGYVATVVENIICDATNASTSAVHGKDESLPLSSVEKTDLQIAKDYSGSVVEHIISDATQVVGSAKAETSLSVLNIQKSSLFEPTETTADDTTHNDLTVTPAHDIQLDLTLKGLSSDTSTISAEDIKHLNTENHTFKPNSTAQNFSIPDKNIPDSLSLPSFDNLEDKSKTKNLLDHDDSILKSTESLETKEIHANELLLTQVKNGNEETKLLMANASNESNSSVGQHQQEVNELDKSLILCQDSSASDTETTQHVVLVDNEAGSHDNTDALKISSFDPKEVCDEKTNIPSDTNLDSINEQHVNETEENSTESSSKNSAKEILVAEEKSCELLKSLSNDSNKMPNSKAFENTCLAEVPKDVDVSTDSKLNHLESTLMSSEETKIKVDDITIQDHNQNKEITMNLMMDDLRSSSLEEISGSDTKNEEFVVNNSREIAAEKRSAYASESHATVSLTNTFIDELNQTENNLTVSIVQNVNSQGGYENSEVNQEVGEFASVSLSKVNSSVGKNEEEFFGSESSAFAANEKTLSAVTPATIFSEASDQTFDDVNNDKIEQSTLNSKVDACKSVSSEEIAFSHEKNEEDSMINDNTAITEKEVTAPLAESLSHERPTTTTSFMDTSDRKNDNVTDDQEETTILQNDNNEIYSNDVNMIDVDKVENKEDKNVAKEDCSPVSNANDYQKPDILINLVDGGSAQMNPDSQQTRNEMNITVSRIEQPLPSPETLSDNDLPFSPLSSPLNDESTFSSIDLSPMSPLSFEQNQEQARKKKLSLDLLDIESSASEDLLEEYPRKAPRERHDTMGSIDLLSDTDEDILDDITSNAITDSSQDVFAGSESSTVPRTNSKRRSLVPPSSLVLSVALNEMVRSSITLTTDTLISNSISEECEENNNLKNSDDQKSGDRVVGESGVKSEPAEPTILQPSLPPAMNDNITWETVIINDKPYQIDGSCIQPYKHVVAHGGFYQEKSTIVEIFGRYLPDSSVQNYTWIIDNLFLYLLSTIELLVQNNEYVIVFFNNSVSKNQFPSTGWMKKSHFQTPRFLRKNLKAFYIVQSSFYMKTLSNFTRMFLNRKAFKKMRHLKSHLELKQFIPIDFLFIPDDIIKKSQQSNKNNQSIEVKSRWKWW